MKRADLVAGGIAHVGEVQLAHRPLAPARGILAALAAVRATRGVPGIGLLGGFTTFSAFAVESVRLTDAGAAGTAAVYVAVSVLAGLLLVRFGAVATRRRLVGPVVTKGSSDVEEGI